MLNGSPRGKNGNTNILTEAFLGGIEKTGKDITVTRVFANALNIRDCSGCFSCWNKTPGKCIFRDDMETVLKNYIEADLIVYATPLYHFGMTAQLKRLIERTLPIIKPYMVKIGNQYIHPSRYEKKEQKHILISNCGFPEMHHFDDLVAHMNTITGGLDESILCTGGEMLALREAGDLCKEYLEAANEAGVEFITDGRISELTRSELKKSFIGVRAFVDVANSSWNVPGDTVPSLEEVHGTIAQEDAGGSILSATGTAQKSGEKIMAACMNGMRKSFRSENAKTLSMTLEMDFTDIGEAYHFVILDGKCDLREGHAEKPTTTICAPSTVWTDISMGKKNGATALMQGLYSVKGDFGFMMKFSEVFASGKDKGNADAEKKTARQKQKGFLKFISPMAWLGFISFIPWYLFWFTSASHTAISSYVPFGLSLLFLAYRKTYLEVTPFDSGSVVYFAIMCVWQLIDPAGYLASANLVSSIGIAAIWGSSLLTDRSLTTWYSKGSYDKGITASPVFETINRILTMFWVLTYLLQAVLRIILPTGMPVAKNILLYGMLILAGFFTAKFPMMYMSGATHTFRSYFSEDPRRG